MLKINWTRYNMVHWSNHEFRLKWVLFQGCSRQASFGKGADKRYIGITQVCRSNLKEDADQQIRYFTWSSTFIDFSEFTRNHRLDLVAVRNVRGRGRGWRKATTKTTEKNIQFFVKKCNYENNQKNAVLSHCVPIEATLFGIAVVLHKPSLKNDVAYHVHATDNFLL